MAIIRCQYVIHVVHHNTKERQGTGNTAAVAEVRDFTEFERVRKYHLMSRTTTEPHSSVIEYRAPIALFLSPAHPVPAPGQVTSRVQ
jgi:hypothetical protein